MSWNSAKSGRLVRKAAGVMQDKGYLKGSTGDPQNGFCIRGAVNYAWCGNAQITDNFEYMDTPGKIIASLEPPRSKRNPQVVRTLTDFRDYLYKSGLLASDRAGVECFNDNTESDEVLRWMNKFADEVDPQK